MSRPAPDFTLQDELGRPVSLHSYRGRVVILAFNDSECTTVCPLTTTAMLDAKAMLGAAASQVQLLGIDANPNATALGDVRAYSMRHGMLHAWHFLTAPLPELQRVWRAYDVAVQIQAGQIDHTPALYMIDPHGTLRKVYLTQMSYASVPQLGQLLAQEAASLLPGHPRVQATLSYQQVPPITPGPRVVLPRAGGGSLQLNPPGTPRLLLFFATWGAEVTDLAGQLQALGAYNSAGRLPALTAVDEGSVEPGPGALPRFLASLPRPLAYPVAVDRSGRVADGYGVQDEPWFVLVSASGRVVWYYDISTSGWLSTAALIRQVRAALAHARAPSSAAQVEGLLAGSPPPLASLHRQAGELLGGQAALAARLRALRGYPVVVNAWASWCSPCRAEFGLFASASARFGRRVAFVGVDTDDSAGDARAFLSQHRVSYPSYQGSTSALRSIAVVAGLPTTIFIDRTGKVAYVHTGQYEAQGTLDQDVADHSS
jgi:cytochrome oxidase Cu insertion factor (SCO1/SenC/PrrC family)/thiol-disulfide isomerase/thioredoxin